MRSRRLGVNIDHIASLRNARGGLYPSVIRAGKVVEESEADFVTIHLREDRRHINDKDAIDLINTLNVPLNLEIAMNHEMLEFSMKHKPYSVCIVPEKRQELTTEGGINLKGNIIFAKDFVKKLKDCGISVSFFMDPEINQIDLALETEIDAIEIHAGKFSNDVLNKKSYLESYKNIESAVEYINSNSILAHIGHGLDYSSLELISKIKNINDFNIGHFIVSESLFDGLISVINKVKKIIS